MKTIKILCVVGLSFYFLGCASRPSVSSHAMTGPDGSENEIIYCTNMGMENCYKKASEACGGTYKIVNSNESNEYMGRGWNEEHSQVLVKCDSGRAVKHFGPEPIQPGAATDPYAKALKFSDCESYEALDKDRCREDVYQRQQSVKASSSSN